MSEVRARHVAIIVVGIQALVLFVFMGLVLFGMGWTSLFMPYADTHWFLLGFLSPFFVVGALIVGAAFSRFAYYALIVGNIAAAVFVIDYIFDLTAITASVIALLFVVAPHVFYLIAMVTAKMRGQEWLPVRPASAREEANE